MLNGIKTVNMNDDKKALETQMEIEVRRLESILESIRILEMQNKQSVLDFMDKMNKLSITF